ncbi:hypothetical protein FE257_008897 [Aspergillus nanangensis]|uniref:AMP-dependent synthetase/ligase domain-containing protein n=1 Tax=Aspergillus nanangensis TaxID=2582783 RepID=A0AAD4CWD0_ASPNN|nr:hypothetical protein FE257_008897 [Aspergillus nanangensis]
MLKRLRSAYGTAPDSHPEEARDFLELVNASVLVTVPATTHLASPISQIHSINLFEVDAVRKRFPTNSTFVVSSNTQIVNPEKGFVVLHTSGTTGPPKGVLHTRRGAANAIQSYKKLMELTKDDLWLHWSPVHWMGGFIFMIGGIMSGVTTELGDFLSGVDAQIERLKQEDITCMIIPPYRLIQIADIYDELRRTGGGTEYQALANGLRRLRVVLTGTTDVSPSVRARWEEMRSGKPLLVLYSASELLGPVGITDWKSSSSPFPSDSCGRIHPTVSLKISDTGEMYVKSPAMFQRYISRNCNATKDVLDSDGFYRTGDIGKVKDDILYVLGRASYDVILIRNWKVYAPELEEALSLHPLVSQAIVLGLPDTSNGYRIAAVLVLSDVTQCNVNHAEVLDLSAIRKWLAVDQGLPAFKLPTVLRLAKPDFSIPRTASLKPIKAQIKNTLLLELEAGGKDIEMCELMSSESGIGHRPFDWEGYQQ